MKTFILIVAFTLPHLVYAQYPGGKVIRINGTEARVINNKNDAVTITLWSFNMTKTSSWFKKDKSLGLMVKSTISGTDVTNGISQTSSAQGIYLGDVTEYSTGQVYLPLEGNVLNNYFLKSGNTLFTSITLDIKLIRNRSATGFGFVVKGLAELTKELPFPSTPFDPAIKSLTGSLTKLMGDDNDTNNQISEKASLATIVENFNQSAMGLQTSTGMFAVVFGTDQNGPGYIDPNDNSQYTLTYQLEPTRAILVATKDKPLEKTVLLNDNLLFSVDAYSLTPTATATVATTVENIKQTTISAAGMDQLKKSLGTSDWFLKSDKTFQQKILNNLPAGEINMAEISKPSGKISLTAKELLIRDYSNALHRRALLGATDLTKFPDPKTKK